MFTKKTKPQPTTEETPDMPETTAATPETTEDPSSYPKAEGLLKFHEDPNNKYMGHFFYFPLDEPTSVVTTDPNDKTKIIKTVWSSKTPLRLADIDTIMDKYNKVKGTKREISLDNASISLPEKTLDALDAFELKYGLTVAWAHAWAHKFLDNKKAKKEASPKVGKAGTAKTPANVTELAKLLIAQQEDTPDQAKWLDPDALAEKLKALVNNDDLRAQTTLFLGTCKQTFGRIKETGAIRLRNEKDPDKVAANKAAKAAKALAK